MRFTQSVAYFISIIIIIIGIYTLTFVNALLGFIAIIIGFIALFVYRRVDRIR
jgi:uncharacterized membrane protein YiaA